MNTDIALQVKYILDDYDPDSPGSTANSLRAFWLQFEPKSIDGIKAEEREQQETVGIPVPVLKDIGKGIAKIASKRVDDFIPLTRMLWDNYGREGRVVALIPLGKMELAAPETILPLLKELCQTCITWEDADRLAMDALEPVIRKAPQQWLDSIEPWLDSPNMWLRRASIIVVGRLAMKQAQYTGTALQWSERLLFDEETVVKRAVSFAIRLAARGEVAQVVDFLTRQVPPANPVATWVLCDIIRSMTPALLPEFAPLLARYQKWCADPDLSTKDRKSIESAIRKLHSVQD